MILRAMGRSFFFGLFWVFVCVCGISCCLSGHHEWGGVRNHIPIIGDIFTVSHTHTQTRDLCKRIFLDLSTHFTWPRSHTHTHTRFPLGVVLVGPEDEKERA